MFCVASLSRSSSGTTQLRFPSGAVKYPLADTRLNVTILRMLPPAARLLAYDYGGVPRQWASPTVRRQHEAGSRHPTGERAPCLLDQPVLPTPAASDRPLGRARG